MKVLRVEQTSLLYPSNLINTLLGSCNLVVCVKWKRLMLGEVRYIHFNSS